MMTTTTERTVPPTVSRRRGADCGRRRAYIGRAASVVVGACLLGAGAGGALAWAGTPTVQVGSNATFGAILTNSARQALYTLNTDHNGQSTCHGSCAAAWPPLDVPAGTTATAGPGVTGTVGTSKQSDGTTQVTYNGAPLYTFVSDTAADQVTGNNVSGFFVVTAGLTTSTTTVAPTPTATAPPAAGTSAPGTPAGAPATASGASGSTTPPAPATSPGVSSAGTGTLAFTGAGPGLRWLFVIGLSLLGLGTVCALGGARRRRAQP
jgi:predicted lipoprotein with Yx(FWY)xxD motif